MKLNQLKTNIAVIGSRSITINIDDILSERICQNDTLISGGAHGIDKLAEEWAKNRGIATIVITPDYSKYGK